MAQKKQKYTFLDNSGYPPSKIMYICKATDILKAIILFEKETNTKFSQKYISVTIT